MVSPGTYFPIVISVYIISLQKQNVYKMPSICHWQNIKSMFFVWNIEK